MRAVIEESSSDFDRGWEFTHRLRHGSRRAAYATVFQTPTCGLGRWYGLEQWRSVRRSSSNRTMSGGVRRVRGREGDAHGLLIGRSVGIKLNKVSGLR